MKILHVFFMYIFIMLALLVISAVETYAQTNDQKGNANIVFTAALTGAQESSSDTSHATATAWAVLTGDSSTLAYRITYAGLTSKFAASHFHLGFAGKSGPVIHPITFSGNTASGTWTGIPDSLVGSLLRGEIYINIHSSNYPNGEIRGQLKPARGIAFTISPDPAQSGPTVNSTASGTGYAVLSTKDSALTLTYGVTFAGLSSSFSASHFHIGNVGVSGGVIHPITFTDSSAYGTWNDISDVNLMALLKNGVYLNIHSSNYPAGEIRGQLMLMAPVSFMASLDGNQESPAVTTPATGTGTFVLDTTLTSLSYSITYAQLSDVFTASHFHLGAPGVSGGVVHPITYNGNTAAGIWTNISDSLLLNLVKGNLYVNVHSKAHPAGEIRGQVLLNQGIALFASLSGAQSVPPLNVSGSGTAWLSLVGDTLNYHITIAGLSSAYAASHFHLGDAGTNGPVEKPITFKDSTATGTWDSLNTAMLYELIDKGVYINVHTANNPAGEIRGQVMPSVFGASQAATGVEDIAASLPGRYELNQNYPNPFNPATTISFSVPKNSFVTLKVYNILGKEVATLVNEQKVAGNYKVIFNGNNLSSGVYFYRMDAGGVIQTRKLMLLK